MIQIEYRGGFCCPVIICDECGRKITDYSSGSVEWTEDGKQIFHAHKSCDEALQRRYGFLLWEDLADHFHYLFRNIGLTPKAFREAGKRADETSKMLTV